MRGLQRESVVPLPSVASQDWQAVGVNGFTADGIHDVIWQSADDRLLAWIMNGTDLDHGEWLTPAQVGGAGWRVRVTADLAGYGSPGLVWQHLTDDLVVHWAMNGLSLAEGARGECPDSSR